MQPRDIFAAVPVQPELSGVLMGQCICCPAFATGAITPGAPRLGDSEGVFDFRAPGEWYISRMSVGYVGDRLLTERYTCSNIWNSILNFNGN